MSTPRDDVLKIFRGALAAVHGTGCVERFLAVRRLQGVVYALALGKAAEAMLQGARAVLGQQLRILGRGGDEIQHRLPGLQTG